MFGVRAPLASQSAPLRSGRQVRPRLERTLPQSGYLISHQRQAENTAEPTNAKSSAIFTSLGHHSRTQATTHNIKPTKAVNLVKNIAKTKLFFTLFI